MGTSSSRCVGNALDAVGIVAAVTTRHAVRRVGLRDRGGVRLRGGAGGRFRCLPRARRLPSARSGRPRRRRCRGAELAHRVDGPSSEVDARQSAVSGAVAVVSSGGAKEDGQDRNLLVDKDETVMQGGERVARQHLSRGVKKHFVPPNHLPRSGDGGELVLNDHVTRKRRIVTRQVDRDSCPRQWREDGQL